MSFSHAAFQCNNCNNFDGVVASVGSPQRLLLLLLPLLHFVPLVPGMRSSRSDGISHKWSLWSVPLGSVDVKILEVTAESKEPWTCHMVSRMYVCLLYADYPVCRSVTNYWRALKCCNIKAVQSKKNCEQTYNLLQPILYSKQAVFCYFSYHKLYIVCAN